MINYTSLLLRLSTIKTSEGYLQTYLQYCFPESDTLALILSKIYKRKKNIQEREQLPISNMDKIPELLPEEVELSKLHLIPFINNLLFELSISETLIKEFNIALYRPEYWLEIVPFLFNSRNLNVEALNKKIDPIIGRSKEVDELIHILATRRKKNPVLIGDAGVGKTAIIEGLADRINKGNVPLSMLNKTIIEININEFIEEQDGIEKFGKIMSISNWHPNIILFLDELHMITKAKRITGIDIGNLLKPYLARDNFSLIGATTDSEYRYLEKDKALVRRFQVIKIEQPTEQETKDILMGIKDKYSSVHHVKFNKEIIDLIYTASTRLSGFNPDKSITVMDYVMASLKIKYHDKNIKASVVDVIDVLRKRYKIKEEFLGTRNSKKAYASTLTSKLPIYADKADDIIDSILLARESKANKKHECLSFICVSGTEECAIRIARKIAETIDPNEQYMFINGYEFIDKIQNTRIKGSPPAYIGHEDPTMFDKIRHNPIPIIFANFDKFNIEARQTIIDMIINGSLETNDGEIILFKNVDIIITVSSGEYEGSFVQKSNTLPMDIQSIIDLQIVTRILTKQQYSSILTKLKVSYDDIKTYISQGYTAEEIKTLLTKEKYELKRID